MSVSKMWSMLDELSSVLPWANCWRRDGYWRTRLQATTRQSASVVIVVDCVRSNWNHITCCFWLCSRLVMLDAKADLPTPGDPLIQITLWLSVFLISVSIFFKMSRRVPSIHGSQRGSLFSPRALTKSSSSFCSVLAFAVPGINLLFNKYYARITDSPPWRFAIPASPDFTSSTMASDTTNQTSWTIKGDTSTRPCLTRMSIVSSTINFLLKLSSLPRSSTALSFSAATKMYWPSTDESGKNLSHIILTYVSNFRATPEWNLSLLPLGSKTHLLSGAVRPSLELPEVCGAGPPEFECPLQGFSLIHKILLGSWDATNFISCTIRIENRGKPTWYAASMQESTIFAIGFNCFKSNNSHPCFSRMIYRTDNISNFNTHFYTITCRSKTIQNGLELVQVVHRALGLCMQHFQVTIMSL